MLLGWGVGGIIVSNGAINPCICVSKLTIIGSDNGLSPWRRQTIIWTNAGLLLIAHLGTNASENLNQNLYIFIEENALENIVWKMVAILSRPQYVKSCALFTSARRLAKQSDPPGTHSPVLPVWHAVVRDRYNFMPMWLPRDMRHTLSRVYTIRVYFVSWITLNNWYNIIRNNNNK